MVPPTIQSAAGQPELSANEHSAPLEEIAVRGPLAGFASQMEKVLQKNDHKGGWDELSIPHLLSRLDQERDELMIALHDESPIDEIQHECCDVANIAMMIFDNLEKQRCS